MSGFQEEQVSRTTLRIRELQRKYLRRFHCGSLPVFIVTEFPKSGGTWFAKMLSDATGIAFPPAFSAPRKQAQIMRGHYSFNPHYRNTVVVVRDGRDVMVSAYHHFLFPNEANVHAAVEARRKNLAFSDFDDVSANMPRFIRYMFEEFPKAGYSMRFSWAGFVKQWHGHGDAWVKYEDLLVDAAGEVARVAKILTGTETSGEALARIVQKYSFNAMTGRKPGEAAKGTFARKGIAGDWQNVFTEEAKQLFEHYAGEEMKLLGYVMDNKNLGRS